MKARDIKLGVLAGGKLGYQALLHLFCRFKISCILTDKKSIKIIDFAKGNNINLFVGNPRDSKAKELIKTPIDVLLSVNYLFLIENDLIKWPRKCAINIHGSLLPKYRGRTPHIWAVINNEKFTGVTAHLINEGCDSGDVIKQVKIPIKPTDTGNDILLKYQRLYPQLIEKVLINAARGNLKTFFQDSSKATYFGKRTPEDGRVNWNWQKERIYNWVRALAKPYPGAFTYYNSVKIIFHKLSFSDLGFSYNQTNGLILKVEPGKIFVKSPNGVVIMEEIEKSESINFCSGTIFG